MIDNSKNPQLTLVYEKDGIKFYGHTNPLEIAPLRGIAIERSRRFMDMNLTKGNLTELIKEIKKAAGENDVVKAFSIVQEIEYRLHFIGEEKSILEFVSIYYLLEDEDPGDYNEVFTERKMKMFEENKDMKGFFLDIGLSLIETFSKLPAKDLKTYLVENQMNADRIKRFISSST